MRYVELNPVRAGLSADAISWEWSSARCHAGLVEDDLLAASRPFPGQWRGDWMAFLDQRLTAQEMDWIRQNLATGRPTGSEKFVKELEGRTGKVLAPAKPGRKKANAAQVIDLTEDLFG